MARALCMFSITMALLTLLCDAFLHGASSLPAPFRQHHVVMTRAPLQAAQRTLRVQPMLDFKDPEIVLKTGTTVDRVLVWIMLVTEKLWDVGLWGSALDGESQEPSDLEASQALKLLRWYIEPRVHYANPTTKVSMACLLFALRSGHYAEELTKITTEVFPAFTPQVLQTIQHAIERKLQRYEHYTETDWDLLPDAVKEVLKQQWDIAEHYQRRCWDSPVFGRPLQAVFTTTYESLREHDGKKV